MGRGNPENNFESLYSNNLSNGEHCRSQRRRIVPDRLAGGPHKVQATGKLPIVGEGQACALIRSESGETLPFSGTHR
jgi:hypothetical protein